MVRPALDNFYFRQKKREYEGKLREWSGEISDFFGCLNNGSDCSREGLTDFIRIFEEYQCDITRVHGQYLDLYNGNTKNHPNFESARIKIPLIIKWLNNELEDIRQNGEGFRSFKIRFG